MVERPVLVAKYSLVAAQVVERRSKLGNDKRICMVGQREMVVDDMNVVRESAVLEVSVQESFEVWMEVL